MELNNNLHHHHHHHHHQDEDDHDEVLSLRDLPLTTTTTTSINDHHHHHHDHHHDHHSPRSSSSSSSDFFFQFLLPDADVISPADDVIFPFSSTAPPPPPRRSLSLSSATRPHTPIIRPSRSLDSRKPHQTSKPELLSRNSSSNTTRNSSISSEYPKPWYWLLAYGIPARFPAEMELKDIKSRQCRRPARLYSGESERFSGPRTSRLLSVLSCKSHASVDVMNTTRNNTAPFDVNSSAFPRKFVK